MGFSAFLCLSFLIHGEGEAGSPPSPGLLRGGPPPTPGVDGTALGATSLEGLSGGAPAFGGSSQESSCQAASFQQI